MKTLLVSLNNQSYTDTVLAFATKLAHRFDSHLVGLYVMPSVLNYDPKIDVEEIFEGLYADLNNQAKEAEKTFTDYCIKENIKGEWRLVKSPDHFLDRSLIEAAHYADLTILGCPAPDSKTNNHISSSANIIQGSGRPVLIVPNGTSPIDEFENVILGWNGSRESTRAVYDALPLMSIAKKTVVYCINDKKEITKKMEESVSNLVSSLLRHHVDVYVESITSPKNPGKVLFDRCGSSDLLVIGAYGHSRLRENILGGVTATILEKTNCPVLLSN